MKEYINYILKNNNITSFKDFEEILCEDKNSENNNILVMRLKKEPQDMNMVDLNQIINNISQKESITVLILDCTLNPINFNILNVFDICIATENAYLINFNEKRQIFVGDIISKCKLNNLNSENLLQYGLVNKIVKSQYVEKEVEKYIEELLMNKTYLQIKSIKKCFNFYKKRYGGIREELIAQEVEQFCKLALLKCKDQEEENVH